MSQFNDTAQNRILQHALAYASRGWPVFPIIAGKKEPATPHGFQDATTDQTIIWGWFTTNPTLNLAIRCGGSSGPVVLDIDRKTVDGEESLRGLEARHRPLPYSPEVLTPSGGRHIYFLKPEGVTVRPRVGLAPGIDLRADDSYVLLPPSVIDGRQYQFEITRDLDCPIAPLPDWLFSSNGHKRAEPLPAVIHEGERNAKLTSIAGTMRRRGASEAAILAALLAENQRCVPPLPEAEVEAIAKSVSRYEPGPEPDTKPRVQANARQLGEVAREAFEAMLGRNKPPRLFVRGGVLCRVINDEHGEASVQVLRESILRSEMADAALWFINRKTKDGFTEIDAAPPVDYAREILAWEQWPGIPALEGIVTAPTVTQTDKFISRPGYDSDSRLLYVGEGFDVDSITGSASAIQSAKEMLDDLLHDFPFVDDSSEAHAIGFMILPFVRRRISGPTPNHLFDAAQIGSGKGLCADVCTIPYTPAGLSVMTAPRRDTEEWRKRITTVLMAGRTHILLDNLSGRLASDELAAAITAPWWEDRELGTQRLVRLPQRLVWASTGNNLSLSGDLARRTVWIRLDAGVEKPWERTNFRHRDLRAYTRRNRPAIVRAICTLLKTWLIEGCPAYSGKLPGSFESWASVVGGILEVAQIGGFLHNAAQFYEKADPHAQLWRSFVDAWHEKYSGAEVGTADLFPIADTIMAELLTAETERARKTRFGILLVAQIDRVYGQWKIIKVGAKDRATRYRLDEPCLNHFSLKNEPTEPYLLPMRKREKGEYSHIEREQRQGSVGSAVVSKKDEPSGRGSLLDTDGPGDSSTDDWPTTCCVCGGRADMTPVEDGKPTGYCEPCARARELVE